MVMTGFVLFSCQKDEKKIVGVWKYEKIEIKELSCTDPEFEAELRAEIATISTYVALMGTVEFTKDGKVTLQNAVGSETGTYTLKNKTLTIVISGESPFGGEKSGGGTMDCTFPKKNTMQWDADALQQGVNEMLSERGVTKYVVRTTLKKQ